MSHIFPHSILSKLLLAGMLWVAAACQSTTPPTATTPPLPTATATLSSTATPAPTATPDPARPIANDSFESGADADADGWSEGAGYQRSADRVHMGGWALKATAPDADGANTSTESLPVRRATYYRLSAWVYKANADGYAYVDMNDIPEELSLTIGPGSGGAWTHVTGLWYSGERTTIQLRCVTDNGVTDAVWFDDITLTEETTMANPRHSMIVTPTYPTDDVVVSDYNVLDYAADPTGANDATDAIQQALNDCHQAGGGTVWAPLGTYKVTRTIFVWPFCTLRGDWRDPDTGPGDYGTVIQAEIAPGTDPLFLIGGSAATMGLTVYYPHQDAANPVEYGWTFEIRGTGWSGNANYHSSAVINCTLINAYRGVGINAPPYQKAVHELSRVHNVKGTALFQGLDARNCADVGTWRQITFSNRYWAEAPAAYHPPARAVLDAWTRANGVAFTFAGLEWDAFYQIAADTYHIGISFVRGERINFAGQFLFADIRATDIALQAERSAIDYRTPAWGVSFLRSTLEGTEYAINNAGSGYFHLTDSTLLGKVRSEFSGRVVTETPGNSPTAYPTASVSLKPARAMLYDITQAPYNAPFVAPNTAGQLPTADATVAIQRALDDAGAAGGGIVYLPAGWYFIATRLTVPAHVELRGASPIPHRSQDGLSNGTVLFAVAGEGTSTPATDPAFITLQGDGAGLRGLRVFYPHNSYADDVSLSYPYAVRLNGRDGYVVNTTIENGHLGLDVTAGSDRHTLGSVFGATTDTFINIGATQGGRVEDCHSNPNFWGRHGYFSTRWLQQGMSALFEQRRTAVAFIRIQGAQDEYLLNNFIYAARYGVHVLSGTVNVFNIGTDNLGSDGYTVRAEDGAEVWVWNSMRYNGRENTSGVKLSYNALHL